MDPSFHSFDSVVSRKSLDFIHKGGTLWKFPSEVRGSSSTKATKALAGKGFPSRCAYCNAWVSTADFYARHLDERHFDEMPDEATGLGDSLADEGPIQELDIETLTKKLGVPRRYWFSVIAKSRSLSWRSSADEVFDASQELSLLQVTSISRGIVLPGYSKYSNVPKTLTIATIDKVLVIRAETDKEMDIWYEGLLGVTFELGLPPITSECQLPSFRLAISTGNIQLANKLATKENICALESTELQTLLSAAIVSGTTEVVSLLLSIGALLSSEDRVDGYTYLHCAVASGNVLLTKLLLSVSATSDHINLVAPNGDFPIHAAAQANSVKMLDCLLCAGADARYPDHVRNRTALHYACECESLGAVSLLMDWMDVDDVNHVDIEGDTALHIACSKGQLEIVRTLLQSAADPLALNRHDLSPMAIAIYAGFKEITQLLEEYEKDLVADAIRSTIVDVPATTVNLNAAVAADRSKLSVTLSTDDIPDATAIVSPLTDVSEDSGEPKINMDRNRYKARSPPPLVTALPPSARDTGSAPPIPIAHNPATRTMSTTGSARSIASGGTTTLSKGTPLHYLPSPSSSSVGSFMSRVSPAHGMIAGDQLQGYPMTLSGPRGGGYHARTASSPSGSLPIGGGATSFPMASARIVGRSNSFTTADELNRFAMPTTPLSRHGEEVDSPRSNMFKPQLQQPLSSMPPHAYRPSPSAPIAPPVTVFRHPPPPSSLPSLALVTPISPMNILAKIDKERKVSSRLGLQASSAGSGGSGSIKRRLVVDGNEKFLETRRLEREKRRSRLKTKERLNKASGSRVPPPGV